MKAMLVSTMVVGLLLLAGCASGPVYRPATTPNDYGYRETALTDSRYRVSFASGYRVARETVANLALYRAAQVALARGAQRFRLVSEDTDSVTTYTRPITTISHGYGYPFWGFGFSLAYAEPNTRYQTVLVIELGPSLPVGAADVYDTHQVMRHLGPLADAMSQ